MKAKNQENIKTNYNLFLFIACVYIFISTMFYAYRKNNIIFYQPARKYIIIIMFILLLITMLYDLLKRKKINSLIYSMLFFICYVVISILYHNGLNISAISSAIWWFTVFYLAYSLGEIKDKKIFDIVIIISSVFTIYLYYTNVFPYWDWTKGDEGVNAIYYPVCLLPFVFNLDNKIIKNILIFATIIISLMSGKSTALFMSVLGSFSYYCLSTKKNKNNILIKVMTFLLIVLLSTYILLFCMNSIKNNVDFSGNGRVLIWSYIIEQFKSFDLWNQFLGIGPKGVSSLIGLSAHNDFFEILLDYGIIGLLLYINMFIRITISFFNSYKKNEKNSSILLSTLLMTLIISSFSHVIFLPRYFIAITFFWGYTLGLNEKRN